MRIWIISLLWPSYLMREYPPRDGSDPMARKARILSRREAAYLKQSILEAAPRRKSKAVPLPRLLRRLDPYVRDRRIPRTAVLGVVAGLRKTNQIRISTRVGLWIPRPGEEAPPTGSGGPRRGGVRGIPQRRIRVVVSHVCTICYRPFPSKAAAKAHWAEHLKKG